MLKLEIPGEEYWDYAKQEFVTTRATTLLLEHSLLSLSKWESKWHLPFFAEMTKMTPEQMQDYIRCMTLNRDVPDEVYDRLTDENRQAIYTYINDPMTATWFHEDKVKNQNGPRKPLRRSQSVMTSEVFYYDMVELGIPFECEKWHLNRLMTLIRVCNEKHKPPKKVPKNERLARQRELNAKRRKEWGTKG